MAAQPTPTGPDGAAPTDPATSAQIADLAARHGLNVDAKSIRINEAGLDYRVAFAQVVDGGHWVLRIPRRADVSAKLADERAILDFIAPRLSIAVPRWEVCNDELVAYPRLPGSPGLTLDAAGQPEWHFDPSSTEFASALGKLIAELQAVDTETASAAGVPSASPGEVRARWRSDLDTVVAEFELAADLRERWENWLANDALWPEHTAFTHGELYAAHVLIDTPARIVGVLDWTTAKVADPAIDFTYQHMMGPAAFDATVAAYRAAGGREHPNLAARCAELAAAAPLNYGLFALASGNPEHRATAAAQLKNQAG